MEALEIARWQFGITTVYHFFFSPLTMGLAVLDCHFANLLLPYRKP
jgi:cytochrome bd ubiquinol oxidase subunit I